MRVKTFLCGALVLLFTFLTVSTPGRVVAKDLDPANINIYNSSRVVDPGKVSYKISIESLGGAILSLLLFVAGAAVVIMLGYGAILYITSGGNEANADKAKKVLLYAIVGFMVVSLSFIIRELTIGQTNQALSQISAK